MNAKLTTRNLREKRNYFATLSQRMGKSSARYYITTREAANMRGLELEGWSKAKGWLITYSGSRPWNSIEGYYASLEA
jgi:hypothetical protein